MTSARYCSKHGGHGFTSDCVACSANETVGHPEIPAPVVEPSQGAEEAWVALRDAEGLNDFGEYWFKRGYGVAKVEQAAVTDYVASQGMQTLALTVARLANLEMNALAEQKRGQMVYVEPADLLQLIDVARAAAKAEQPAGGGFCQCGPTRCIEDVDTGVCRSCTRFVRGAEAAPSEPLIPTTDELVETVAAGMGDSGYVQRADALDALSELARRVKA